MTVNVDPELGEILGLLGYKLEQQSFSLEALQKELGWEEDLSLYLERERPIELEQILQLLKLLSIHPCDFFLQAFGLRSSRPEHYQEELRLELIRLLNENLEVFGDRPDLPTPARQPMADSRMVDYVLLKERSEIAVKSVRDLAAVARWMMTRLPPADRQMLVGLCERLGTFEAAIDVMPDLLAIVGTPAEAAWALEHERQLMLKPWRRVDDVADDVNLEAVVFLLDLEIKAGRRQDIAEMVRLREELAPEEGDDGVS